MKIKLRLKMNKSNKNQLFYLLVIYRDKQRRVYIYGVLVKLLMPKTIYHGRYSLSNVQWNFIEPCTQKLREDTRSIFEKTLQTNS